MENNQKRSKGTTALIVLLLLVTIVSLILATFAWAKYTSTFDGTANAVVARWNVNGSSSGLTWTQTFSHVVAERLAPGTHGAIPVSLVIGSDTEVDARYTITIVSAENKPTNLKFYTDSTKNTEIQVGGVGYSGTVNKLTGTTVNNNIYWEWPYETGDGAENIAAADIQDTADGTAAKTMTVTIKIDAVQINPAE